MIHYFVANVSLNANASSFLACSTTDTPDIHAKKKKHPRAPEAPCLFYSNCFSHCKEPLATCLKLWHRRRVLLPWYLSKRKKREALSMFVFVFLFLFSLKEEEEEEEEEINDDTVNDQHLTTLSLLYQSRYRKTPYLGCVFFFLLFLLFS